MNARARQILFAVVFVAVGLYLTLGLGLQQVAAIKNAEDLEVILVLAGAAVCGAGLWLALRSPRELHGSPLVRQAPVETAASGASAASAAHGYRGAPPPPKASRRRTSTRATVGLVLGCLAFTATALPFAFHLPRWVEAELVLAAWWVTWAIVLTVLAYRGRPLDESHRLELRGPFASSPSPAVAVTVAAASAPPATPERSRWYKWLDLGSADAEGFLFLLVAAIVVGIALFAAWLVIELAAPAVFFLAYLGIARALGTTLASSHRGDMVRSGLHGAAWATAYVAPIAGVIAILHGILAVLVI